MKAAYYRKNFFSAVGRNECADIQGPGWQSGGRHEEPHDGGGLGSERDSKQVIGRHQETGANFG